MYVIEGIANADCVKQGYIVDDDDAIYVCGLAISCVRGAGCDTHKISPPI